MNPFFQDKGQWGELAVLLFFTLLVFGCASQGLNIKDTNFDPSNIEKIQENKTSAEDVIVMLGKPGLDNRDGKGNGQMVYVCRSSESNVVKTKWLRILVLDGVVKKCNYTEHIETDGGEATNNSSGKIFPIKMIPF